MLEQYMDTVRKITQQMLCDFNELTLPMFEEYGITEDNVDKFRSKVLCECMPGDDEQIMHYFMGDDYMFSIKAVHKLVHGDAGAPTVTTTYHKFQREKESDPEQED